MREALPTDCRRGELLRSYANRYRTAKSVNTMTQKGTRKDIVEVFSCRDTSVAGGRFTSAVLQLEIMWKYSACLFGCNAPYIFI